MRRFFEDLPKLLQSCELWFWIVVIAAVVIVAQLPACGTTSDDGSTACDPAPANCVDYGR